ncbi:MAG: Branched-chain amino acid dehydrogenase [deaminating](EC [uncultured Blastococcus sp.]|uniref:Branched-chain amino acid dehydrogenase [deaminating](EC) n=1 Tax=uncultured Blastococcus sp. TaxID=217144 RepID=A0A6J4IN78_9ACTN|nr:MAG: Branched-chain amino acid dehydrogenase [deaminating](EC [uncultured Blastococcus sp.]
MPAAVRARGRTRARVYPEGVDSGGIRCANYAPDVEILSSGHEQVVFCSDRSSGLRAVIAVHSTALGPALGGTRFYPYPTEEAAVADALRLSAAMSYKNSLAGLDLGGGKAVIIGDPRTDKTEALLRAYGRFVEALGGRYLTACDVGTYNADLDVVARETRYAHGRSEAYGGCGDSSVLTAYGVYQGMRAAAQHCWGSPSLSGRTVAVAGVGKVGSWLVGHLVDEDADVVVTDVDPAAVERLQVRHPSVRAVADTAALIATPHDVYAPCALGGALDEATVAALPARIVCGGANNQLAAPEVAEQLRARGILYAPDYLVNAGGVIQVEDERHGFSFARAQSRASGIYDVALRVFRAADDEGVSPAAAADRLAEERIASVGRLATIRLPR